MRQVDCLQLCYALSVLLFLCPCSYVETNRGPDHRNEVNRSDLTESPHICSVSNLIKAIRLLWKAEYRRLQRHLLWRNAAVPQRYPLCYHSNRAALELTGSPQSLLTNCLILLPGKMRSVIRNQTSSRACLLKERMAACDRLLDSVVSCLWFYVHVLLAGGFTSPLPLHHNMIYIWMSTQTA